MIFFKYHYFFLNQIEWNQPNTPSLADELFQKALALAGSEFVSAIRGLTEIWLPARTLVVDALIQSSGGM